jgi:hypothetical protein
MNRVESSTLEEQSALRSSTMRKQFVLDKQADKLLNELAYYFGGNRSMVIREVTGAIAGSMPGTGWSTAGWWRIRFISGASGARIP